MMAFSSHLFLDQGIALIITVLQIVRVPNLKVMIQISLDSLLVMNIYSTHGHFLDSLDCHCPIVITCFLLGLHVKQLMQA